MTKAKHVLEGTADDLLARLREAQLTDKSAEKGRTRWIIIAVVSLVLGFPLSVILVGIPLVLFGIYAIVKAVKSNALDVEDAKLAAPARFLSIARADMPPARPLKVELDLREHNRKEFARGPAMAFSQSWLDMRWRLADGNAFRACVTRNVKRKERRKRKYTRVKERMRETLDIQVQANPERYPSLEGVAAAMQTTFPPTGLTLVRCTAQGNKMSVTLATKVGLKVTGRAAVDDTERARISGDLMLSSLVWLYRGLKQGKKAVVGG